MRDKKGLTFIALTIITLIVVGIVYATYSITKDSSEEESNGKIAYWAVDEITLMRIPQTGDLACFGCGETMCIDPIQGLEVVEESFDAYCDSNLNVVRSN